MNCIDFENSYLKKFYSDSFFITKGNSRAVRLSNEFVRSFATGPRVLSIWGSVGNGKTHLLGAISNEILSSHPGTRISVASLDFAKAADLDCNLLILDSADLILRSGQLCEEFLMLLLRRNISVLISSAICPSGYFPGLKGHFRNYLECEVDPPSLKELTQFVDMRMRPSKSHALLANLGSFRKAEAEIFKAKIKRDLCC